MMPIRSSPRLGAACATLVWLSACGPDRPDPDADPNLFTAARSSLRITVKENAELQASRETLVRSQVEGQATIIYLVPEGSTVKQGDKLVELDASELVEKRDSQGIAVYKAEAADAQARKELEILQKELVANRNTAQSNLNIARMELEKLLGRVSERSAEPAREGRNADMVRKLRELVAEEPPTRAEGESAQLITYVDPRNYQPLVDKVLELLKIEDGGDALQRDMGEMSNRILQQVDQIRLSMADLKVKEDTFSHSRRLEAKKFITRNELERDQLAYQSQISKVTLAWNDLDLLINYTLAKERIKLRQDVENAELLLEQVLATNQARQTRAETEQKSKEAEYQLVRDRLANIERQIKNAVILAPTPGLVVYARVDRDRRGGEAIREGISVRERQELIILPDTTRMRAVLKVQEAEVEKVARGQRAVVQVEAFPGFAFTARVISVAPVADSSGGWMTSDRKVYTTVVELDADNPDTLLRSRMAAQVTIEVGEVENALPVPLQAVRRDRSVNYVWKVTAAGPLAQPVEVGRHTAELVDIKQGLEAGERIYLTPPAGVAEPRFPQPVVESATRPGAGPAETNGQPAPGRPAEPDADSNPAANGDPRAEMRALNTELRSFVAGRFPERAAEAGEGMGLMRLLREAEVSAALQAEKPELYQRWQDLTQRMRQMGPGRGQARPDGEAPRGEGRRGEGRRGGGGDPGSTERRGG